jgi:hypothetical protein
MITQSNQLGRRGEMLQFVTTPSQHKHEIRGDGQMKEITVGNTKIIIHSELANMTDEEKEQWFESEKAKGNPILKQISEAMMNCYQ